MVKYIVHKHSILEKYGLYEVVEIFQIGTILFLTAIIVSFVTSCIFTEIDKKIDEIENEHLKTPVKFFETYLQLIIISISYFYVEKIIYIFPSLANQINKNYKTFKSANYVIHIILIIVLIETNSSMVKGIHFMADKLNINGKNK